VGTQIDEGQNLMDSDPAQPLVRSRSLTAERMRLHRKRRREGSHFVRVELNRVDIDGLIRRRLLRPAQRHDPQALQVAVMSVIYRFLEAGER
jgi:hypothetical protein